LTTQTESNQNGWLTIREAALALGISELTVRRRIKDGRVDSKLENGKYYVRLGEPRAKRPAAVPAPPAAVSAAGDDPAPPAAAVDLESMLQEQVRLAELAGRARLLEEQLRQMEARYAALQEGALSLSNRNGWLESKLEERETEIKLLEDSRHRRRWWRRLFGGQGDS
jgi:hypothetical protein